MDIWRRIDKSGLAGESVCLTTMSDISILHIKTENDKGLILSHYDALR